MICFPNAKINLGLQILSKRNDGYHNISTLLYPIPYYDVLEFLPAKSYKLTTYGLDLKIPEHENLVTKAWSLMHQDYNIPFLEVKLLKRITSGSGLGGGSSDAAFFIKSLNDYFKLNLSVVEMQQIAMQIGSDCPFFIQNEPSIISGKGELVEPCNVSLQDMHLALILPEIHISTKMAYSKIVLSKPKSLIKEVIKQPITTWSKNLLNDFEEPVLGLHPELNKIKTFLYKKGAIYASMTGSGSALYGIFDEHPDLNSTDIGYPTFCTSLDKH